ncbi:hypothetical protein CON99_09705 [Bacillus pseudomycoides]|nr:hypothetical protein CON99_09705 [Bacillus pseudomycoides]
MKKMIKGNVPILLILIMVFAFSIFISFMVRKSIETQNIFELFDTLAVMDTLMMYVVLPFNTMSLTLLVIILLKDTKTYKQEKL